MTLKDVLEAQIDAAIKGLVHARTRMSGNGGESELFHEVSHQLEKVSHHLKDIRYNWLSLTQPQRDKTGWAAAGTPH